MSGLSGGEQYLQGLLPVYGECRCSDHKSQSVKIVAAGAALVREVLTSARMDPALLLETTKCKHCCGVALLRLKDLHLVA